MPRPKKDNTRVSPLREQILCSALQLYSSRGYFKTSIHDIQQGSGVSMGSIYNHFTGKSAIAQALYDDLLERMETLVDAITTRHADACSQGRAVVGALFELTESEPEMVGYILNARHREFLPDEPGICSSRPFEKMRDIVLTGIERGEVRPMDPWIAASLAFGPALRMISLRLDGLIPDPLPESLDSLWEMTWSCIRMPQ